MDVIKSEEPAFPTDLGYLFAPPSAISGVGDDSSLDHLLNLDQFDLTSATLADDDAGAQDARDTLLDSFFTSFDAEPIALLDHADGLDGTVFALHANQGASTIVGDGCGTAAKA